MTREDERAESEALMLDDLNGDITHAVTANRKPSLLRSLLSRFTKTLPSTRSDVPSLLRTAFNYPGDNFELRSTSWLDGLRGIAALEVFIFHYLDGWMDKGTAWGHGINNDPAWYRLPILRTFYASAETAVCVFFAISGYVLTYRMLGLIRQQRHEQLFTTLSSAVCRRGIRLYMPVAIETFALMILGRYSIVPRIGNWDTEANIILELKRWGLQMIHLFIPLRYPDRWDEILNLYDGQISWTIPLEYHGSIYVYVVILLLSRLTRSTLRLSIMAALVVTSVLKDDWIAGQFLLGMAFADYQLGRANSKPQSESRLRKIFFWCVFIFGFYLAGLPGVQFIDEAELQLSDRPFYDWLTQSLARPDLYSTYQVDKYFQCLAGICLLVGIGETHRLKRFTEIRFVQYLGRISFGFYLCHIFVRTCLTPLDSFWFSIVGLDPKLDQNEREASLNLVLSYILMMAFALPINFVVAGMFTRYVDAPSIRLAKTFEQWALSKND